MPKISYCQTGINTITNIYQDHDDDIPEENGVVRSVPKISYCQTGINRPIHSQEDHDSESRQISSRDQTDPNTAIHDHVNEPVNIIPVKDSYGTSNMRSVNNKQASSNDPSINVDARLKGQARPPVSMQSETRGLATIAEKDSLASGRRV